MIFVVRYGNPLMEREDIITAFPEIKEIEDDSLRNGVIDAWIAAGRETGIDDITTVPWFPPAQEEWGLDDEYLVDHIRDVTACAIALAETLEDRRGASFSLDTIIAGSLVHDISQLAEFDGHTETSVYDLLGHPYYGVYPVLEADLPVELAHIVLSHTNQTAVEPATIEAELVKRADEIVLATVRSHAPDS